MDAYQFDYLLLCNKICGASHYNMQMKIVVEEERDFNKWLEELRIAKKDVVRLSKEIEKLRIELAKK